MSIKSPYQHEIKERKKGDTLRKSGQNFFANSDKKYNVSNNNYIDSYTNTKQSKPVNLDSSTIKHLFDENSNNSLCPNYNMEERNEINPGISEINKDSLERIRNINTKEQLEKLMNKNNTIHDLDGLTDEFLFNNQINLNNNGNNNNNSKNLNPGISEINKDLLERIKNINTKEELEKLMNKNNTIHDLDGSTDGFLFNNQINLNNNGNNNNNSKNLIRNNSDYNRNNNVNQINIYDNNGYIQNINNNYNMQNNNNNINIGIRVYPPNNINNSNIDINNNMFPMNNQNNNNNYQMNMQFNQNMKGNNNNFQNNNNFSQTIKKINELNYAFNGINSSVRNCKDNVFDDNNKNGNNINNNFLYQNLNVGQMNGIKNKNPHNIFENNNRFARSDNTNNNYNNNRFRNQKNNIMINNNLVQNHQKRVGNFMNNGNGNFMNNGNGNFMNNGNGTSKNMLLAQIFQS